MFKTKNFNFGSLTDIFWNFRIIVFAPSMHGFKTMYPFGAAQTITLVGSYMSAFRASLPDHVIYDGLAKFPMNRTGNSDIGLNCEFFWEGRISILSPVSVSEIIQDGLF
jgi:hypothetical protein